MCPWIWITTLYLYRWSAQSTSSTKLCCLFFYICHILLKGYLAAYSQYRSSHSSANTVIPLPNALCGKPRWPPSSPWLHGLLTPSCSLICWMPTTLPLVFAFPATVNSLFFFDTPCTPTPQDFGSSCPFCLEHLYPTYHLANAFRFQSLCLNFNESYSDYSVYIFLK